jgi:hypothetical protein
MPTPNYGVTHTTSLGYIGGCIMSQPEQAPKRMLKVYRDGDQTVVEINSSSLDIIQTCPKKAEYSLKRGLTLKGGKPATTFGSGIHKALEVMYSTPREQRELPKGYKDKIIMMCQGQELPEESDYFVYRATRGFLDETTSLGS